MKSIPKVRNYLWRFFLLLKILYFLQIVNQSVDHICNTGSHFSLVRVESIHISVPVSNSSRANTPTLDCSHHRISLWVWYTVGVSLCCQSPYIHPSVTATNLRLHIICKWVFFPSSTVKCWYVSACHECLALRLYLLSETTKKQHSLDRTFAD